MKKFHITLKSMTKKPGARCPRFFDYESNTDLIPGIISQLWGFIHFCSRNRHPIVSVVP